MDAEKVLSFFKFIGQLKEIERFKDQYFWKDYPHKKERESVADHTWRMAMMLVVLEPHLSRPLNLGNALKMCLVHDLPEIIAGDASPLGSDGTGKDGHHYNEAVAAKRYEEEKAAAKKIFSQLPDTGEELYKLWIEFEEQKTFEAQVVKAMDKLEGKLQAAEYLGGVMFKEHLPFNLAYGIKYFEVDPAVKELSELVLKEFTNNYKEFTKEAQ